MRGIARGASSRIRPFRVFPRFIITTGRQTRGQRKHRDTASRPSSLQVTATRVADVPIKRVARQLPSFSSSLSSSFSFALLHDLDRYTWRDRAEMIYSTFTRELRVSLKQNCPLVSLCLSLFYSAPQRHRCCGWTVDDIIVCYLAGHYYLSR